MLPMARRRAVPAVENGVGEEDFARGVHAFEQRLVLLVAALQPEANRRKRRGRRALETRVGVDLSREFLRPRDVRCG